ncbi:MAG: ABC transporter ATP-binding protein [Deltaproteobacteria bacterium]
MLSEPMPTLDPTVVKAVEVSREFLLGNCKQLALSKINFVLKRKDFSAIAGPSGSGKSTLLNILGCLDRPTSGEVLIEGVSTQQLSIQALAEFRSRKLGFVFQTFNLIPTLTALENVEYPLLLMKLNSRERKQMAEEALVKVGLENFKKNRPNQMSGGQRQRVAIARAMVKKPILILADEPTANLDHKTANEVLDLMQKLNGDEGVTFLFSSHDPLVLNRASQVTFLEDGTQVNGGIRTHVA